MRRRRRFSWTMPGTSSDSVIRGHHPGERFVGWGSLRRPGVSQDGMERERLCSAIEPPGGDDRGATRPARYRGMGTDPRCRVRRRQNHSEDRRARPTGFGVGGRSVAGHDRLRHEFDLVVSFNALHWVPEQDEALRSIRATLRPGSRAIMRFVPAGERKSLEDVIEEVRESAGWAIYFRGFRRPYVHLPTEDYRSPGPAKWASRGPHPHPG